MTYIQLGLAYIAGASSALSVASAKASEPSLLVAGTWYGIAVISFLALAFFARSGTAA